MVTVEVYRDAAGRIRGFRSTGHAGYGAYGQDIVCAAVSAITQTAVLGLLEHVKAEAAVAQAPGRLECKVSGEWAAREAVQAVLAAMTLGLREVERQYPKHVRVRDVEVSS
ncbi:MAG: ribosomal-processing cysteine protease Prp [Limnochordales bacterium]|jgi:Predicted ribosomal protein|nr:ribosomal-processing cysteine protease Prp [Bacillota bacterium]